MFEQHQLKDNRESTTKTIRVTSFSLYVIKTQNEEKQ